VIPSGERFLVHVVLLIDAPPEFVGGQVEIVQLDADLEGASDRTQFVSFDPCPEAEIENDSHIEPQKILSDQSGGDLRHTPTRPTERVRTTPISDVPT
jgi:hypothetical protein